MKRIIAVSLVVAVVSVASVAGAQWLASGQGEGAAQAGTVEGLSITPGVPTGLLFPGQTGDVALTIGNTNTFDIEVVELVGAGPVVSTDPACETAGHEVTFTAQVGSWVVPGGGTLDVVLVDAAHMGAGAAVECQGVTFLVPLALVSAG